MIRKIFKYSTLAIVLLFIVLLIINIFPLFYFKSAEFETGDYKIKYSYKWDLFAYKDIAVDRKIELINNITGNKKSHKLLIDGEDIYEISFFNLKNGILEKDIENSFIIRAPWLVAIVNLENLDMVDMAFNYELLNTKFEENKLVCIGKVGRNGFVPVNCKIKDY